MNSFSKNMTLEKATVVGLNGLQVKLADGTKIQSKLAVSCLIRPELDDEVLVCIDNKDSSVLAILSRTQAIPLNMSSENDIILASNKTLHLKARRLCRIEGETIASNSRNHIQQSDELRVESASASVFIDKVTTNCERLVSSVKTLMQTVSNSFRSVSGVDQVSTKEHILQVKGAYQMQADHALVTAKKDIKMDAERIHMG